MTLTEPALPFSLSLCIISLPEFYNHMSAPAWSTSNSNGDHEPCWVIMLEVPYFTLASRESHEAILLVF
ncbi:hypothetical protein BHE74_00026068 [Ensete ventricosum]|nr:hypothetical protein BHE74_00026068 [Ensete ventricosum]